jgi:hypothetical protein
MTSPFRSLIGLALAMPVLFTCVYAQQPHVNEPDPKALAFKLPADIKWSNGTTSQQAVLYGDPTKEGLYVVLNKWLPHNNSRPHFHPNDRAIYVIKGTWYVGTGAKYDPEGMKPMPAGTFVTHFGKEVHYDGAKDEECILEIVGMGPATSTQVTPQQ